MDTQTKVVQPDKINQAIEDHYGLWWTDESKQAILNDVGEEGLAIIKEIEDAANSPDLWLHSTNEQAYAAVQTLLRTNYPFLTAQALIRIATSAAYGWK